MDRSYPYTRRLARRTQLHKRMAALAAVGAAGCAVLYALMAPAPSPAPLAAQPAPSTLAAAALPGAAPLEALKPGQRRVYPYSIVPGGVTGARELGRVIREDKVVAAHYAEFDMARAHETTVTTPRAVHVSYRKGDKVYWTAKKVMLAEGETLVSDGKIEARARCANQISDTPRLPVEAHGPSAEELDSSVVENNPAAAGGLENVSMGMLEGEGVAGGFLNAAGTGSAGGILAGGSASERESLFAAAANVPGASSGAFLSSRSSSSRGAPGKGAEESSGESGAGDSGGSGGIGGGIPTESNPSTGTPGSKGPDTPSAPSPQPATPQPSTPGATPGDGGSPTTPGTPGTPSQPEVPSPVTPGGGQSGGGESGTPSQPPTDIGGNPAPGGPGGSPAPEPSLEPPKEPVQPGPQPSKPVEVPEPGSLWLLAPGLALLLVQRRRKRHSQALKTES
ncbi:PEP-CTERM sorting domain-containing protein [Massilia sp. BKSP1R2A-1]|uniref:PEP-CTERM sorting domain-containing protein n=1 Tax=Massilia sp. BKSP1R2A-1 TaxID=3422595 RepID=UPI003D347E21